MVIVEWGQLPTIRDFAGGGFAKVAELPGFTLPGNTGPLVLKRYHPRVLREYHGLGPALHTLISFRNQLSANDRARLDNRMKWPLALVRDGGAVVGTIMSRLADRFFFDMPLTRGGTRRMPREIDHYLAHPDRTASKNLHAMSSRDRIVALARFGSQLELLHSLGVVVGDIQGNNLVIDPNPGSSKGPIICMYDCDSYRVRGSVPAIPQPHALAWKPPELSRLERQANALPSTDHNRSTILAKARVQNASTDVYKFGLLIIRLMSMRNGMAMSSDPRTAQIVLSDRALLGRRRTAAVLAALNPPESRPTMAQVMQSLQG